MPRRRFALRGVGIARSRTKFVIYGANYNTDPTDPTVENLKAHGVLDLGRFPTRIRALRVLRSALRSGRIGVGKLYTGHLRGDGKLCSAAACEGRMLPLLEPRRGARPRSLGFFAPVALARSTRLSAGYKTPADFSAAHRESLQKRYLSIAERAQATRAPTSEVSERAPARPDTDVGPRAPAPVRSLEPSVVSAWEGQGPKEEFRSRIPRWMTEDLTRLVRQMVEELTVTGAFPLGPDEGVVLSLRRLPSRERSLREAHRRETHGKRS